MNVSHEQGRAGALLRRMCGIGWSTLLAACAFAAEPSGPSAQILAQQLAQYDADVPKTILELQPFRTETRAIIRRSDQMQGSATLINLNPNVNAWYLLTLAWPDNAAKQSYHLETPRRQSLSLRSDDPDVIRLADQKGVFCDVWVRGGRAALEDAAASGLPYAPLCGGWLYLRNQVAGHRTSLERVTDFLRDHVWGGERMIAFVKKDFYRDAFLERGGVPSTHGTVPAPSSSSSPLVASVAPESAEDGIVPQRLALDLATSGPALLPGQWYPVRDLAGVTVSAIAPQNIASRIRSGRETNVNPLDSVELKALVYLVAFDLQAFDVHFALGTDHPRLDWSGRPPASSHDSRLPGPDGVASAKPLVTNGMVNPAAVERTVATFTGGFRRSHGAFRAGPFSVRNHGSHYGFIEQGVIFSKLQPGLATVLVSDDGTTDLRTWTAADNARLAHARYARQNGVPLIEYDPTSGSGIPGAQVNLWGPGNWSGSADEDLRTLRAGLCLQVNEQRHFLIYGYFSAATPSAMARVFQAYHCRYAMLLDMNALEHTYLALYVRRGQQRLIEHLIEGMQEVDRTAKGNLAPRFLAFPDDRDFFYLTRRGEVP